MKKIMHAQHTGEILCFQIAGNLLRRKEQKDVGLPEGRIFQRADAVRLPEMPFFRAVVEGKEKVLRMCSGQFRERLVIPLFHQVPVIRGKSLQEILRILTPIERRSLLVGKNDPFCTVCRDNADSSLNQIEILLTLSRHRMWACRYILPYFVHYGSTSPVYPDSFVNTLILCYPYYRFF